jgi:GNAT superfamily N-acetyltransferase
MKQIRRLGERPGDLGWVVQAHAEIYGAEYGWGLAYEVLIADIVGKFALELEDEGVAAWIAEVDGERRGRIFCVRGPDDGTAQLRLLLVDPAARGLGLGAELVDTCLSFARAAGYKRMVLWTNDPLTVARRIYLSRGFRLTSSETHELWGEPLVGQYYEIDL